MDAHELVARVKALALELGRSPTRIEFENSMVGGKYKLTKLFSGNYSKLLQAAGLDTYSERRGAGGSARKIDNTVFERDIAEHLSRYHEEREAKDARQEPGKAREQYLRTLVVGDLHAPFANLPLLEAMVRFAEAHQPEVIVQVGDLYDLYSHSKFARSHNLFTPREEHAAARKQAESMWAEMRKAAPNARCIQAWGNHDARPLKRVLEVYPGAEDWVERMMVEMMTFPGVETTPDFREEILLPGNVMVHHGYRSKLGDHRNYTLHNFICGHTHVGGVVYRQIRGEVLWELNAGLAGDPNAKGLSYTQQRSTNWTPGWGWVDEYGPRFIAFNG